jgi:hypothetical protein
MLVQAEESELFQQLQPENFMTYCMSTTRHEQNSMGPDQI